MRIAFDAQDLISATLGQMPQMLRSGLLVELGVVVVFGRLLSEAFSNCGRFTSDAKMQ